MRPVGISELIVAEPKSGSGADEVSLELVNAMGTPFESSLWNARESVVPSSTSKIAELFLAILTCLAEVGDGRQKGLRSCTNFLRV
jgi:hypothetical protein